MTAYAPTSETYPGVWGIVEVDEPDVVQETLAVAGLPLIQEPVASTVDQAQGYYLYSPNLGVWRHGLSKHELTARQPAATFLPSVHNFVVNLERSKSQHQHRQLVRTNAPGNITVLGKTYASQSDALRAALIQTRSLGNVIRILALRATASSLLEAARGEDFETGFRSRLSAKVERFVAHHGEQAVKSLVAAVVANSSDPDVVVEVLTTLGQIVSPDTKQQRRQSLVASLNDNRAQVRRGALIGLSHLDDSSVIADVKRVIDAEKIRWVKSIAIALWEQLAPKNV